MAFGGFGASSTPAFGATSTPAFGAPAATPAFGASSTPAFGAAASTASLFGASSTPAFGASSTPAFGSFGAAAPSPFGTPAASTPAFGAPAAASTPSLFGAAASPSTGSAFSFSVPSSSSAAASGAGAFGSLFSGAPAAQPAAGGALFGALSTTQQPAAGGQPGVALAPLAYSSAEHENVKRELEAVAAAYMPQHPGFKFQHLFLNVVDNPGQRVRPPQVSDELSWKQALRDAGGPENPHRLWPVLGVGFEDLLRRAQAQAAALAENRARLEALRDVAHKLAARQSADVVARVAAARARHVELSGRLLAVARHVDGLEGRLASYMGIRGELSRGKEAALSHALEAIEVALSPSSPAGLQRRLDALAAAARLRAAAGLGLSRGDGGGGGAKLDEASLASLFGVLKEHVEAVRQLQEVLRRDMLDVEVMRGSRQDSSAVVPAAMNIAAVEYV